MYTIGVIMPAEKMDSYLSGLFRRFKCKIFPVEEYGICFAVVFDNQNCGRIMQRHGVRDIVLLTDAEVEFCSYNIIDGTDAYKRMLPEFMRKIAKSSGGDMCVTVVDRYVSDYCFELTEKLCGICRGVRLVCENTANGEKLARSMEEKYGIIIEISDKDDAAESECAVVLEDFGVKFSKTCKIVDIKRKKGDGTINDFYIPFKVKPPFGMKNLVFYECAERAADESDSGTFKKI